MQKIIEKPFKSYFRFFFFFLLSKAAIDVDAKEFPRVLT